MAHKLVELIAALNEKGIKVWLIGGYALDAIYGKLTRDHHDFDLLIEEENIVSAQKIIQELGYHYSRLDSIKGLKWAHSHPDIEQEGFKLELGLLKKGESENTYRVGPFDLPKSYFPNETQGILLQIPLRTITLEGNIKLNELLATLKIEELDEYHHALHNEVLLEKIQEKKS